MMNKTGFMVFLLLCYTLAVQAQSEKFIYELRFGFIKGGEAVYQIKEETGKNEGEIHATLHGYTTGFAKKIYGVDDFFESFISKDQNVPTKSRKRLKEKGFRLNEEVTFDQENGVAFSKGMGSQKIERGICDVSSIMYHLQSSGKLNNLQINQIVEIPFWDTGEWYMLSMKYTGIEKINTCLGKIDCLRLEPQKISGRFFNKRNPINLWITNDLNKWPVLIELNFTVGSVKCVLSGVL